MSTSRLLGRLAVHYQLISREKLIEALQLQQQSGGHQQLGNLLVSEGFITQDQLELLLKAQHRYLAKQERDQTGAVAISPQASTAAMTAEDLSTILESATDQGASDVHFHSGKVPRMRYNGSLTPLPFPKIPQEAVSGFLAKLLNDQQRIALDEKGQVDFAISIPDVGRLRGSAYRQHTGLDAVLRIIPNKPPTLEDLGLPDEMRRLVDFRQGMVVFTGPIGCGKTSTMAAVINLLNETRGEHIITVEDPIEYLFAAKQCVINQRQVGRDTQSFARALKGALREDPDVIVIGELRDLETISLALTAAETGHLVFASMHTTNAIGTINRLIGSFPPKRQSQIRMMVSESLRAIVSQRLVARADGQGREAALELLWFNLAVGNLVREGKVFQIQSVMQTGSSKGMRLLDDSLRSLLSRGIIEKEEARRAADDPAKFIMGIH